MLKLTIEYESSWRNSFLDGDNNSKLPSSGRKYIGSSKSLNDKKSDNFIKQEVTHNTVMGILNRLIGQQKKLYQARNDNDYVFKDIDDESIVSFKDNVTNLSEEIVYLRNFSKSKDQNSFSGMIDVYSPAFSSEFSEELWSVLFLDFEDLCDFILGNNDIPIISSDPISVSERYSKEISKMKNIKLDSSFDLMDKVLSAESLLSSHFGQSYRNSSDTQIQVFSFYCSALYLQVERLSKNYDLSLMLTRTGNISGFSKKGFTYKDFMKSFTTGNGKLVFGNPYVRERFVKGEGSVKDMLNKASGVLTIFIDVNKDRSLEIKNFIDNAGVMSFYLGKKGIAYLLDMKVIN